MIVLLLLAVGGWRPVTAAAVPRPADGEFVRDRAELLSPGQRRQVNQRCEQLLTDTGVPVFVLTVNGLAELGDAALPIEALARDVFERWGQEHLLVRRHDWKRGVLFVVAERDRQTRIELGRAFGGRYDAESRAILDDHVLPRFRSSDYAGGVTTGVGLIEAMVRGRPPPGRSVTVSQVGSWIGLGALAVASVVSLLRSGRSGWGAKLWGGAAAAPGALVAALAAGDGGGGTNPTRRTSGGSSGSW
ncbi:MAG: TPM domain-containing protein [Planctomycetota bacterium]